MRIGEWFRESHRWQHFVGGVLVGMGANDPYCAAYTGIGVAGALEFKDWQSEGARPELADFLLTVAGVAVGYSMRVAVITLLE